MSNKITPIWQGHSDGTVTVDFYNEADRRIGGMTLRKGEPFALIAKTAKELEKKYTRANPKRRRCQYKKTKKVCRYRLARKALRKNRPKRRNGIISRAGTQNIYDFEELARQLWNNHHLKNGVWYTDYPNIHGFKLTASSANGTSGTGKWFGSKVYFWRKGNTFVIERD